MEEEETTQTRKKGLIKNRVKKTPREKWWLDTLCRSSEKKGGVLQ